MKSSGRPKSLFTNPSALATVAALASAMAQKAVAMTNFLNLGSAPTGAVRMNNNRYHTPREKARRIYKLQRAANRDRRRRLA